jgi:hypothetical protein
MTKKHTRKNKRMRGGEGEGSMFSGLTSYMPSMPDTSSLTSYMPDTSSFTGLFSSKKENVVTPTPPIPTTTTSSYPTEGGKKKRRRRRIRGGSYSPNSSSYGANAGPYSGPPTARAQAWVGGRKKSRKKRRKN